MNWLEITVIGTLAGTLGTGTGWLFSRILRRPSDKTLGVVLGISAGVMLAIIFMELLQEAIVMGFLYAITGLLSGMVVFILLDNNFPHHHFVALESKQGKYIKKGLLIAMGIALHNIPEGIAIGAGYVASPGLGFTLAVLIVLHNIPEGMAVAVPLNAGGSTPLQSAVITALAGLPMGLGAFLGAIVGKVSLALLGVSLGFAAGAMLYIVWDELLPDVYGLTNSHTAVWGITAGVLLGMAMIYYL